MSASQPATNPDDLRTDEAAGVSSRRVDELMKPGMTLMVGTKSGDAGEWEFRPLTVARVSDQDIDILLDTREDWVEQLSSGDSVHVTLSDNRSNDWAHLTGTATISHDDELIDELWSPFAGAYFEDGRETSGIAALRLSALDGRFWSSPSGRVGSLISMVSAALGKGPTGEHGDIDA